MISVRNRAVGLRTLLFALVGDESKSETCFWTAWNDPTTRTQAIRLETELFHSSCTFEEYAQKCQNKVLSIQNSFRPPKVHFPVTLPEDPSPTELHCCGRHYSVEPKPIICNGTGRRNHSIKTGQPYFEYQDKHFLCQHCFTKAENQIKIHAEQEGEGPIDVNKSEFKAGQKNYAIPEKTIDCCRCGNSYHNVCVLYLEEVSRVEGFTCDSCLDRNDQTQEDNIYSANNLGRTVLGDYVEDKLTQFIQKETSSSADERVVGKVTIRVVSTSIKTVTVMDEMYRLYVETNRFPNQIPYTQKVLLGFQEVDGVDVCFFGMYVHEYGSECPGPNRRSVYISFLDSVQYFRPGPLRSPVYREIFLGYLEYVKKMGYENAFLWACSPAKDVEYIFAGHPPHQRFPGQKALQNWYRRVFDQGVEQGILDSYMNILEFVKAKKIMDLTSLPYLEGDLISAIAIEEGLRIFEREKKKKRPPAQLPKSCTSHKYGILNSDRPSVVVASQLRTYNDQWFAVQLRACKSVDRIVDPDPLVTCDVMDSRDNLFSLALDARIDFTSLRRAKFATRKWVYEIHKSQNLNICVQDRDRGQGL